MKSRIIIWTIVGIIVIVGLVFLLTAPKPANGKLTLEQVRRGADQAEAQLDRLAVRAADLRKTLPKASDTTATLGEAGRLMTGARAKIAASREATEQSAADTALKEAKRLIRTARRVLEKGAKPGVKSGGL